MKYIYLFTGVLVYIQLHIQLWEYVKKHGWKRQWSEVLGACGKGAWIFFVDFILIDSYMVMLVLDKVRIGILGELSDTMWSEIIDCWTIATFGLLQVTVLFILYVSMKATKGDTRTATKKLRGKVVFSLIGVSIIFLIIIYMAMGGDISPFIDGVAWQVYKLLLFLGIVDH